MDDLAYKLIYADKSELRIYARGEAMTYNPKTDKESPVSAINVNYIPRMLSLVAAKAKS